MASVFPHRPPVEHAPHERADVVVGPDEPADALDVLSSATARDILAALREAPSTASGVAEDVDKSLQNVAYHLSRLREADLITPVGTWYSEKGREMTVYALAAERLVVRFGDDEGTARSRED
jgi:DNA-binding transcriptional ArsR family regulator